MGIVHYLFQHIHVQYSKQTIILSQRKKPFPHFHFCMTILQLLFLLSYYGTFSTVEYNIYLDTKWVVSISLPYKQWCHKPKCMYYLILCLSPEWRTLSQYTLSASKTMYYLSHICCMSHIHASHLVCTHIVHEALTQLFLHMDKYEPHNFY